MSLSVESKEAKQLHDWSPERIDRAREKFAEESGVRIDQLGGLAIDEVSFVDAKLIGQADAILRQLTGRVRLLYDHHLRLHLDGLRHHGLRRHLQ